MDTFQKVHNPLLLQTTLRFIPREPLFLSTINHRGCTIVAVCFSTSVFFFYNIEKGNINANGNPYNNNVVGFAVNWYRPAKELNQAIINTNRDAKV